MVSPLFSVLSLLSGFDTGSGSMQPVHRVVREFAFEKAWPCPNTKLSIKRDAPPRCPSKVLSKQEAELPPANFGATHTVGSAHSLLCQDAL
mmetsp:Transcript_32559/g.54597  ORF Transcript_32559/g.54597 Transcript_32559/m.54597 type:complete len:91 (-) Transcript_32559:2808-3080(-)